MATKQKKNKKWLYWLLMLVLFVVAAVIVYLVWNVFFKGEDKSSEAESGSVVEVIEDEIQDKSQEDIDVELPEKPKVVKYDGEDPNNKEGLSGAITYAEVNGENLVIRVNIDQYLEGGDCNLNVGRDGVTLHEEVVEIIGDVATSSCAGFDVPVDLLDEGIVDIEIRLVSNGKTGIISGTAKI